MPMRLIIALDFSSKSSAFQFLEHVNPSDCALKIGSEMFTLFGPSFVRTLIRLGYKIFLDLKFYDIPNTVAQACSSAAKLGVWMVNVHASGGLEMMQAAKKALNKFSERPLLIAVTVLTSMVGNDLAAQGLEPQIEVQVCRLAQLAFQAEMDGVVCSPHEVSLIKKIGGSNFLAVTPGIRFDTDNADDQKRIMSPMKVAEIGADYWVMGRSITRAPNPQQVINSLLDLSRAG